MHNVTINLLHKIQSLLHSCLVFYSWKAFSLPPGYLEKNMKELKICLFPTILYKYKISVWASTRLIVFAGKFHSFNRTWSLDSSNKLVCWHKNSILVNIWLILAANKQVYFMRNNIRISTKLDMQTNALIHILMLYIFCYMYLNI